MPHELSFFGVFVSPWLVAVTGGCLLGFLTSVLLNRSGLSQFFRAHQWVFLCFIIIYTCLLGSLGAGL